MVLTRNWVSLFAGAAMAVTWSAAAQAGGTPGYAKGKEPVYRCDTGGFIEYPGTDICFKIGGRAEGWLGAQSNNVNSSEEFDVYDIKILPTNDDRFWMGAQGRLNVDVRSASELGLVRAFIEGEFKDANVNTGGAFNMRHAFVQVGQVLFGKTDSTFLFKYTPDNFATAVKKAPGYHDTRVVQFRYSQKLGNGVQLDIALEDPARLAGAYTGGPVASADQVPDVVGRVSVKGSWGAAQIAFAAHQQSFIFGRSEREWGWAGNAGIMLVLDSLGLPKDKFFLQGNYSDGHSRALRIGTSLSVGATGVGFATDKVTGVSVLGGLEHHWSKTLRSTIAAGYADIDYNAIAVVATSLETSAAIWGNLIWSPVKGLDIGVEVMWGQLDYLNGASADAVGGALQARRKF
jgi:hypothetical protein